MLDWKITGKENVVAAIPFKNYKTIKRHNMSFFKVHVIC
jgi:hypothetical protein